LVDLEVEEGAADDLDAVLLDFAEFMRSRRIGENCDAVEARTLFLKLLDKWAAESATGADEEN
jgi:hypothetical protein